jgi:hypothetical protein
VRRNDMDRCVVSELARRMRHDRMLQDAVGETHAYQTKGVCYADGRRAATWAGSLGRPASSRCSCPAQRRDLASGSGM